MPRLVEGLHHLGIDRLDDATVDSLFEGATAETAVQALDYVNAAVNGGIERPDHSERTSSVTSTIDGKVIVGQYLLPPRHRKAFTEYALERARSAEGRVRKANITAYAIVGAHHNADGNGRSARVIGSMLAEGFDPQNPEDVARIAMWATGRDELASKLGYRPSSYVPDAAMRRSWVAESAQQAGQTERIMEADKQIREKLETKSTTEKYERTYVDPDKIVPHLTGIQDEELRGRVVGLIQQVDFGPLAATELMAETGQEDLLAALQTLDDERARAIIDRDGDHKLEYSEYIIDIVAGDKKPYYRSYDAEPAVDGLSDEYLVKH